MKGGGWEGGQCQYEWGSLALLQMGTVLMARAFGPDGVQPDVNSGADTKNQCLWICSASE